MPGLFEDLIPTSEKPIRTVQPAESGLFDDLIPKENRGDFGLGTAETIRRPRNLFLDIFPSSIESFKHTAAKSPDILRTPLETTSGLVGGGVQAGLEGLNAAVSAGITVPAAELRSLGSGKGFVPPGEEFRKAVQGYPESSREEKFMRFLGESAALNASPALKRLNVNDTVKALEGEFARANPAATQDLLDQFSRFAKAIVGKPGFRESFRLERRVRGAIERDALNLQVRKGQFPKLGYDRPPAPRDVTPAPEALPPLEPGVSRPGKPAIPGAVGAVRTPVAEALSVSRRSDALAAVNTLKAQFPQFDFEIARVPGGFEVRSFQGPRESGGVGVSLKPEGLSAVRESVEEAAHSAATSPANALPVPSDSQREAGNFQKGHVSIQGMDISIEYPRGAERSGVSPSGKKWTQTMAHHYGYIKSTTGKDGEQVDVFIGPNPESRMVFVVDQMKDGKFDEHKALLGFNSEVEARAGYLANYPSDFKGLGKITEMPVQKFREWVNSNAAKKPAEKAVLTEGQVLFEKSTPPGQKEFQYGILPEREGADHVPAKQSEEKAKAVSLRPSQKAGGAVLYPGAGPGIALRSRFVQTGKIHIPRTRIRSPDDVAFLLQELTNKAQENVHVVAIKNGRPVALVHTGIGTLDMSIVHPMNVIAYPMQRKVDTVYVVHNHPSGNPSASSEDMALTRRLTEVFHKIPGIRFAGHIIIEGGKFGFIDPYGNPEVSDVPKMEIGNKTVGIFEKRVVRKIEPTSGELTEGVAARYVRDLVGSKSQMMMVVLDTRLRAIGNFPMGKMVSRHLIVSQILRRLNLVNGHGFILAFTPDMALSQEDVTLLEESMKTAGTRMVDVLQVESGKVSRPVSVSGMEPTGSILGERKLSYEESERRAIQGEVEPQPQKDLARLIRRADMKRAERRLAHELYEKARVMQESGQELFRKIRALGGLKSYAGGHESEEFRVIPLFLRRGTAGGERGSTLDEMAQELQGHGWPFEDGEDLRRAIVAVGSIKKLTIKEFLPQARAMVEENAGELIRAKILSEPEIRNVRSKIRQIGREIRGAQASEMQKAAAVISAAKVGNLTPNQLASFAKSFLGKTGKEQITSKNLEELSRAMVKTRFDLRTGDFKTESRFEPRQPEITGQPPRIPRNRALVTLGPPGGFKGDLAPRDLLPTAELDVIRASEFLDGKPGGWTYNTFVEPAIEAEQVAAGEEKVYAERILKVSKEMKVGSKESARIQRLAEGRLNPNEQGLVTPQEREIEKEGRAIYDERLQRVNAVLKTLGKKEIVPIKDYVTHFQNLGLLESLFGGLQYVPKQISEANYIFANPSVSTPGFMFRRKGGPFTDDYLGALQRYIPASVRFEKMSQTVPALRAQVRNLPPNAQRYFSQWVSELSGRRATLDQAFPLSPQIKNLMEQIPQRTNAGLILANLSTALVQFSSTASGIAENGPVWQARGQLRMATPAGQLFAYRYSRELAQRVRTGTLLDQGSEWLRRANFLLEAFDQYQVGSSFLAAFEKNIKRGRSFEESVRLADIAAVKTNASMRRILKSPVLRQKVLVPIATQLQTFNVNFRSNIFLDPILKGRAEGGKAGVWQFALLIASVIAVNELYKKWLKREAYGIEDALPIFIPGTVIPIGPIAQAIKSRGRFVPAILQPVRPILEAMFAEKDLKKAAGEFGNSLWMFVPGGNQIRKTLSGLDAISRGGSYTDKGKLRFQVEGAAEQARAAAFGPYGTEAGQKYIEGGFKPESLKSLREKFYRSKDPQERERIRKIYEEQRQANRKASREQRSKERQSRRQPAPASTNRFQDLIPAER